jgi:glutaredoxin-like protein NrdH
MVTVYTLPSCVQCDSTKRYLARNLIEYREIDLSKDEAAMEHVRTLGHTQAPVVIAGDEHWSGFRMDQLNKLVIQ